MRFQLLSSGDIKAIDALKAGKHVFLDKPIANTVSDGKALTEGEQVSIEKTTYVSFCRRHWDRLLCTSIRPGYWIGH